MVSSQDDEVHRGKLGVCLRLTVVHTVVGGGDGLESLSHLCMPVCRNIGVRHAAFVARWRGEYATHAQAVH